jgi:hypothetical protein
MDVVVPFALDLEGGVEGDVLLRARLDVDFLGKKKRNIETSMEPESLK